MQVLRSPHSKHRHFTASFDWIALVIVVVLLLTGCASDPTKTGTDIKSPGAVSNQTPQTPPNPAGCEDLAYISPKDAPPIVRPENYDGIVREFTHRYAASQTTFYGLNLKHSDGEEYAITILHTRRCHLIPGDVTDNGKPGGSAGEGAVWIVVDALEQNRGTTSLMQLGPRGLTVGKVTYAPVDAWGKIRSDKVFQSYGDRINPGLRKTGVALYQVPQDLDVSAATIGFGFSVAPAQAFLPLRPVASQ